MGSTNERKRYIVTSPFIGQAHTQNGQLSQSHIRRPGHYILRISPSIDRLLDSKGLCAVERVFLTQSKDYKVRWGCNVINAYTFISFVKYLCICIGWIAITMTSHWARWRLRSPASWLFTQPFIQALIKKTLKLCVTGLCAGNSPVTGEFPAQMASNAKNVSIWWRHHEVANNCIKSMLCVGV